MPMTPSQARQVAYLCEVHGYAIEEENTDVSVRVVWRDHLRRLHHSVYVGPRGGCYVYEPSCRDVWGLSHRRAPEFNAPADWQPKGASDA